MKNQVEKIVFNGEMRKEIDTTGIIMGVGFDEGFITISIENEKYIHEVYVKPNSLLPAVVISKDYVSFKRNQKVRIKGFILNQNPILTIHADCENSIVELL
jgi:hypothetical protein